MIKSDSKKNQVDKLNLILFVFYLSLEYRLSYYKEGCNMVILTKSKCLKLREIPRVVKENQIPKCAEISTTGQTSFAY
jgi:hypothetical protein